MNFISFDINFGQFIALWWHTELECMCSFLFRHFDSDTNRTLKTLSTYMFCWYVRPSVPPCVCHPRKINVAIEHIIIWMVRYLWELILFRKHKLDTKNRSINFALKRATCFVNVTLISYPTVEICSDPNICGFVYTYPQHNLETNISNATLFQSCLRMCAAFSLSFFFGKRTAIMPFYSLRIKFFNKKNNQTKFVHNVSQNFICVMLIEYGLRQDENSVLSLALNKYSFWQFSAFFRVCVVWPTNNNNLKHLPASHLWWHLY